MTQSAPVAITYKNRAQCLLSQAISSTDTRLFVGAGSGDFIAAPGSKTFPEGYVLSDKWGSGEIWSYLQTNTTMTGICDLLSFDAWLSNSDLETIESALLAQYFPS